MIELLFFKLSHAKFINILDNRKIRKVLNTHNPYI